MRYTEKDRELFTKPAEILAPWLLGKTICRKLDNGFIARYRINVTEAYCEGEKCCDATTNKECSQWKEGGHLYVATRHGIKCIDIVANEAGKGEGVLIRGLYPYNEGPGIATKALGIIDNKLDGTDLLDTRHEKIWLEYDGETSGQNKPKKRKNISVDGEKDKELRFSADEKYLPSPSASLLLGVYQTQNKAIFFSSWLAKQIMNKKYNKPVDGLFYQLASNNIPFAFVPNTNDIWMRDFMPIKTRTGKYVSFRYEPSYHGSNDKYYETNYIRDISEIIPLPFTKSDINLDGGNIVFSPSREKAIISDRVFSVVNKDGKKVFENEGFSPAELVRALEEQLAARVIIIPSMPSCIDDMTGHADGMVRFVDENTVVGNKTKYALERNIKKVLNNHGIDVIDFPYFGSNNENGISAIGCYINFLKTDEFILLPEFYDEKDSTTFPAKEMDKEAAQMAEKIFKKPVVQVNINEIAIHGGVLNCISWEC